MSKRIYIVIWGILLTNPKYGVSQNFEEKVKLLPSDRGIDDHFGYSSSLYEDYVVIGASSEKEDINNSNTLERAGSAYIFVRDGGGNWIEKQKIVANDRRRIDYFASSISIFDSIIAVGSPQSDLDVFGLDSIESAGSVYLYKLQNNSEWNFIQKITADDRLEQDYFGQSVAVFNNYLAVGAHQHDFDENGLNEMYNSGAAFVFKKDLSGFWQPEQKLLPSDRDTNMMFGNSISMIEDIIVIGARNKKEINQNNDTLRGSGAVYIFKKQIDGTWKEVQKLRAADFESGDNFGYSIYTCNKTESIVVGAPYKHGEDINNNPIAYLGASYIFEKQTNMSWQQKQKIEHEDKTSGDRFGYSVAISDKSLIATAPYKHNYDLILNSSGSSYVFKKGIDNVWRQLQKIEASDKGEFDNFGFSASLHNNTAVITAYHDGEDEEGINYMKYAGSAYIFEKCSVDTDVTNNGNYLSSNQDNASYQWIDCNSGYNFINGETNQVFYPNQIGNYAVIVSHNSCVDTSFCMPISVSTTMNIFNEKMHLYPNPSSGLFFIDFDRRINGEILIIDILGEEKYREKIISNSVKINAELPNGIYFATIRTEIGIRTIKLIIKE